jgi:biopolymer transport protein ExbD
VGPPRLVDLRGPLVALNGVATSLEALPQALAPLMDAASDPIILRPDAAASVQDMVAVLETLRAAGLTQLVVVE